MDSTAGCHGIPTDSKYLDRTPWKLPPAVGRASGSPATCEGRENCGLETQPTFEDIPHGEPEIGGGRGSSGRLRSEQEAVRPVLEYQRL